MTEHIKYRGWIIEFSEAMPIHIATYKSKPYCRLIKGSRIIDVKRKIDKHIERWGW